MAVNALPNWLTPQEKDYAIDLLLANGLLRWDNTRSLPLKKGGTTDIYVTERMARKKPKSLKPISELYATTLLRHKPRATTFVEVPDSVSCFAGHISEMTDLPYVTIRGEAKSGRVTKADMIGEINYGDEVPIIDDVITDGASKITAYRKIVAAGARPSLIVLVDRQQGWELKFEKEGVNMPVWAGMTLHDIRKFLITKGLMERCDAEREQKNPIILALDGMDWKKVLPIVDQLRTSGCIFKVNDLLIALGTDNLISDLSVYGRVMADIKGHDISNTLGNISRRMLKSPPWAVTVHTSGGEAMMKAAVDVFKDTPTKILGVTVLTSFDKKTCEEIYSELPLDQVMKLAAIAARAGVHGLVCSPKEVRTLRNKYPGMTLVTPGVRSPGKDAGDQKRISTPLRAIKGGANYIVGGRQFLKDAPDPVAEVHRVIKEELGIEL